MKLSAGRSPAWLRLAAFSGLVAVGLLFGLTPGTANDPPHAPVVAAEDDDFVTGDDVLNGLAFEGVEPSDSLPEPQKAQPKKGALPSRVDNSQSKYFPPILQQKGGSCGQASGVHYTLAYEFNLARDLDSRLIENQYPDHWTWNCLNGATGGGSRAVQGWAIVKEIGIPSLDVYGDKFSLHNDYGWPSGYGKYYEAMKNRVDSYGTIPATNPADLERIKGYLFNRNDAAQQHGGLMNYRILFSGRKQTKIPKGQYEEGKSVITAWGTGGAHGMTYVGYDDGVGFDVNGDGKITNDIDITGDGKVDLADWERGAFLCANSHGTKFGDNGRAYVLYNLGAQPKEKGRGDVAYRVKVKKEYQPRTALMLRFKFEDRSALQLSAGFAAGLDATKPAKTVTPGIFNGKFNVGKVPMRGKGVNEPIEIGLDLTDVVTANTAGKFFLNLGRKSGSQAKGELLAACVYHYDGQGRIVAVRNFTVSDGRFGERTLALSVVAKQ